MEIFTFLQHQVTHKVMSVLDKVRNKKKKIAEKKEAELNKSLKPKTKQDLKKMYTELTNDEIKFLINLIGKSEFIGRDVQILYSIVAKLQNKLTK